VLGVCENKTLWWADVVKQLCAVAGIKRLEFARTVYSEHARPLAPRLWDAWCVLRSAFCMYGHWCCSSDA